MDNSILRPDSVALVTGASRGIGLSIAQLLAKEGVRVVCAGRDRDQLNKMVQQLGENACPVVLDVSDALACKNFVRTLPVEFQSINILINNAGHDVGGRRLFHEGSSEDWDAIIETNVKGLMRVTYEVLPAMLESDNGHIINIGSVAGVYSYRSGTVYNASKFAVHGFSEALRKDLDHTNLRVTEILPGIVKTEFAKNRNKGDKEIAEQFYQSFPSHLTAEDVARAVLYALKQPPHVVISQLMIEPVQTRS